MGHKVQTKKVGEMRRQDDDQNESIFLSANSSGA